MSLTFIEQQTLEAVTCANCGIMFAFPQRIMTERRRDHSSFYCPSGHSQHFPGKSDVERARERAEYSEKRATQLACESASLRHQLHGTKGALVKVKKRISAGVCPCCNRTFSNLARHMATKHANKEVSR